MHKKVYSLLLLLFGVSLSLSTLAQGNEDSVKAAAASVKADTAATSVKADTIASAAMTGATANARKIEMADKLRADGKIYVVITVMVVILLGLIFYVVRLDRKINRLEKDFK